MGGRARNRITLAVLGALGALAALVAGCTSSGTLGSPTTSANAGPSSTAPARKNDGVLRIGVLLPTSGAAQSLGPPMVNAIELARVQINSPAGGGVNGKPIQIVALDETDDPGSAAAAADKLVRSEQVDAIIGPASSRLALSILPKIVSANVVVCSPANTAALLTDFPDSGYYFRTVPSDLVQATALARVMEAKGVRSTAIMAPHDDYGRPMARALAAALTDRGIRVTTTVTYESDSADFVGAVKKATVDAPEAVALIALPDPGAKLLAALKGQRVRVFASNGIRAPGLADRLLDASALEGLTVTTLSVTPNDSSDFYKNFATNAGGSDVSAAYAAYAYDCAMLIALAATAAGTDDPAIFKRNMAPVSGPGSSCFGYVECKKRLVEDRLTINFIGASGDFDLDRSGDPEGGFYDVFRFGKDGTERPDELRQIVALPRR